MWRNVTRTVLTPKPKTEPVKPADKGPQAGIQAQTAKTADIIYGGGWQGIYDGYGPDISEVTYYTVLRTLAETVGKLPIHVRDKNHNIVDNMVNYRLSIRPNDSDTPATLMTYIEYCRTHYGNGYAYCKWNERTGELDGIYPLDPNRVRVWVDNVSDAITLKHYYSYENTVGKSYLLPAEDVIHVKTWHVDDLTGLLGIPVRQTLQEYMEAAKGGQRTQNDMYSAGMVASGVLNFVGDMKDPLIAEMLEYTAKIGRSQRIIPLPDGWKLTPVNLSLADNQYLETRKYTALQVASAYGVSPNQLNDYSKGSYANAVAQETAFLTNTLQYISRVYETEMSIKLLPDTDLRAGSYVDIDTDAMLQNTPAELSKILREMAGGSIMTINEARNRANLPPMDGGDVLVTMPGAEQLGGNTDDKQ